MEKSTVYSGPMRFMHWLMVILLLIQVVAGLVMGDLAKGSELKESVEHFHMATGMLLLFLVLLRLVIRLTSEMPAPQPNWSSLTRKMMPLGHWGLYLLLFIVPITGYMMITAHGDAISFYGLFHFPRLFGASKAIKEFMEESHEVLAWVLICAIGGHILLGLKHHYMEKDGTLLRMWKSRA